MALPDPPQVRALLDGYARRPPPRPLWLPQWQIDRLTDDRLFALGRMARELGGIGVQPYEEIEP